MARYAHPEKRIERILDETSPSRALTRSTLAAILLLVCPLVYLASAATPQGAPAPPAKALTFDAVSIKSMPPSFAGGDSKGGRGPSPCPVLRYTTGVVSGLATASRLIQEAYALTQYQISGGPSWVNSDSFCIEAKSDGATEKPELALMLQAMLADRFKLVLRQETKEAPVYLMTVSKPGRLFEIVPGRLPQPCCTIQDLQAMGYKFYHQPDGPTAGFFGIDRTMQGLADLLSRGLTGIPGEPLFADRPVLDRTGLTGTYLLRVQRGENESLLDAMADQFGLKFEPSKAPLPAVTIESISRPSAN